MDIRFDGKVAVVTGAGQGLGRCHALTLAARGAKVVVNDPGVSVDGTGGSHAAADGVVDEIKAAGGEAVADYGSVAEPEQAAAIVDTAIEAFGGIDILINNAGILRDKSFRKMEIEEFELVLKVHLLGSVYVTKAAFGLMCDKGWGRIVMTTSAAGLYGNFGQTNYAAAKMGVVGLMNALKEEGKKYDVLVNTIAPVAGTRMTESILPEEAMAALTPEFVTAAVAYLCSDACTATGDIIEAGAGYYAKAQIVEARGYRFGAQADVTPEMVAEHYEAICDMSGAAPFENALEATQKVMAGG